MLPMSAAMNWCSFKEEGDRETESVMYETSRSSMEVVVALGNSSLANCSRALVLS